MEKPSQTDEINPGKDGQETTPKRYQDMLEKKKYSAKGSHSVKQDPATSSFSNRSTERKKR